MGVLNPKSIGEKIRNIRKNELHETQEVFAEKIKRSTETVSNIERGKVTPSAETLANVFKHTGKTYEQLCFEEDDD